MTERRRRHLAVVAAGRESKHPSWLTPSRNWDLVCLDYAGAVDPSTCELHLHGTGMKWLMLADALDAFDWSRYGRIVLLDDDLEFDGDVLSEALELADRLGARLSQLSLTSDSYTFWEQLREDPEHALVITDFVEVMAPIFSADALTRVRHTFSTGSGTGWGLGHLWPRLLGCECLVFGRLAMRHPTRVSTYQHGHGQDDARLAADLWHASAGHGFSGRARRRIGLGHGGFPPSRVITRL